MKKIGIYLLVAVVFLTTSCYTNQKFYVQGFPGTVITSMDENKTLAVIDQSGVAEIKLKRNDGYYAFLQAKAPNSNKAIPFALDYQDKNRSKTYEILYGCFLVPPLLFVGFLGPMWVFGSLMGTQFDYDYLDYQHTNNDVIR